MFKGQRSSTYPRSFWMLFWGLLINRVSTSLVWPFLTEYVKESLGIALTVAALLITLQSLTGLLSTVFVSPLMDRIGRRNVMVAGLIASGAVLIMMSFASTLVVWAFLMALYGAVNQVFNIGSNAMVADLVEPQRRAGAYALIRMISNLGIAIGPALGGFLISAGSFALALDVTAVVNVLLALIVLFLLSETIPRRLTRAEQKSDGGFRVVLQDRLFMITNGLYILATAAPTMIFSLLFIYVRTHFGFEADQYSWLIVTNAAMVVLFQYSVTRLTVRFRPFPVMAVGAFFYACGAGGVAFGTTFVWFWLCMVVLTVGEMLLNPTVTALVANIAPVQRRARYMGVLSIAYPLASGFSPVIGGFLGDIIAPQATWLGAMGITLLAALGFWLLARKRMFEPQYLMTKENQQELDSVPKVPEVQQIM